MKLLRQCVRYYCQPNEHSMTFIVSETIGGCERQICETNDRSVVEAIISLWLENQDEDANGYPLSAAK